jgi:hypothetical protein
MGGLVQQPKASLEESGIYHHPMPWLPDSNKRASGKAGAVHSKQSRLLLHFLFTSNKITLDMISEP